MTRKAIENIKQAAKDRVGVLDIAWQAWVMCLCDELLSLLPAEGRPELPEEKGRLSEHPCKKCGAKQVYVTEINDHPDYEITCHSCKHSYCVDGPDS